MVYLGLSASIAGLWCRTNVAATTTAACGCETVSTWHQCSGIEGHSLVHTFCSRVSPSMELQVNSLETLEPQEHSIPRTRVEGAGALPILSRITSKLWEAFS